MDIRDKYIQQHATYSVVHLQVKNVFNMNTAILFGVLRSFALEKGGKLYNFTRKLIEYYTHISPTHQSEITSSLEKWKLLKITRNKHQNIKCFEVLEVNFQLFLFFPKLYKKAIEQDNMEYLYTEVIDFRDKKEKECKRIAYLLMNNSFHETTGINTTEIKKNIKELEKKIEELGQEKAIILTNEEQNAPEEIIGKNLSGYENRTLKNTTKTDGKAGYGIRTPLSNRNKTHNLHLSNSTPLKGCKANSPSPQGDKPCKVLKQQDKTGKTETSVDDSKKTVGGTREKPTLLLRKKSTVEQPTKATKIRNSSFAPRTENKPLPSTKENVVAKLENSKRWIQIKNHWNKQPNLKQINKSKNGVFTKTLSLNILTMKHLLNKTIFETGVTNVNGRKVELILPKDCEPNLDEITVSWLCDKITYFAQIVNDKSVAPRNKEYLKKCNFSEFVLGANLYNGTIIDSYLFGLCSRPLQTLVVDDNPKETALVGKQWNLYRNLDKDAFVPGSDLINLSVVARKMKYLAEQTARGQNKYPLDGLGVDSLASKFFVCLEEKWGRGKFSTLNAKYFAGDHAWSVFEDYWKTRPLPTDF